MTTTTERRHEGSPPDEHLTTGWEPGLGLDDGLVRHHLFGWAAQCDAFAAPLGGRSLRTERFALTDLGRPAGFWNSVTLLQPPTPRTLDAIELEVAAGHGDVHLWSAWPTGDLRRRGWRLIGHPPLLIRPPYRLQPAAAPAIRVVNVDDAERLADWERVAVEGYPIDGLLPLVPGSFAGAGLLDDPRVQATVSYEHGRPVAIGARFDHEGLGLFALGVTLPEARGRGHWRAHAVHRLRRTPGAWTAGVFSDFSRGPAEALGFVPIQRLTLWALDRP